MAAVPGLVTFEGQVGLAVVGLLAISAFYVLLRKPLVAIAERLVQLVPAAVRGRLPRRFVEDLT